VPAAIEKQVKQIIAAVKKDGDAAVIEFTERFDSVKLTPKKMRVSEEEIMKAYKVVPDEDVDALLLAARRIADFHDRQRQESWFIQEDNGAMLGQRVLPLRAGRGVYVPGGKASYPHPCL
jgi:histidinol dehydrogenase